MPAGRSLLERNIACLRVPFSDIVVAVGGPQPDALITACARQFRIPVGVIWAGSDVVRIAPVYEATARVRARRFQHAACSGGVQTELRKLGIDAAEVPIVAASPPESIVPLPSMFTVLAYSQQSHEYLYGLDVVLEAARRFPRAQFNVVGDSAPTHSEPQNVKFLGWSNRISKQLDGTTVLLRPTRHDGLSRMVVEALARGRHVIWSEPLQGARHAKDADACFRHLAELHAAHVAGRLEVNHDGLRCVRSYYTPEKVSRRIERYFDDVLRSAPKGKKRAIVSGSPFRVAAFIRSAAESMPDWEIHAAMSGSRFERIDDVVSLAVAKRWYSLADRHEDRFFRFAAKLLRKRRLRAKQSSFAVPGERDGKASSGTISTRHDFPGERETYSAT